MFRIIPFTKNWIKSSRAQALLSFCKFFILKGSALEFFAGFPLPSFRKEAKGIVLFFGAKKRTKRNIHPLQGLPLYGEDATLKIAETDDFQINTKVDLTIKGQI